MKDKTREAVDAQVEWINAVVDDTIERGAVAIREALAATDPEHFPGLLFALLSSRAADIATLRRSIQDQVAHEQFEGLGADDDVTLH